MEERGEVAKDDYILEEGEEEGDCSGIFRWVGLPGQEGACYGEFLTEPFLRHEGYQYCKCL